MDGLNDRKLEKLKKKGILKAGNYSLQLIKIFFLQHYKFSLR
jgi:hypothetical protein